MEIRKVQKTGGSSYVITLPKEWIEAGNVKKNDPLGVVTQPDGTLLITRDIRDECIVREKKIDVTPISDPDYLFRILVSSYISGFTILTLTCRDRFQPFVRMRVREFTGMAIGPQVIEETSNTIVLKDLLNPGEMPFENTLKRMFVIVRSMHEDAITALELDDGALSSDVIQRDNDVDRLHWLIARQANMILANAALAAGWGLLHHSCCTISRSAGSSSGSETMQSGYASMWIRSVRWSLTGGSFPGFARYQSIRSGYSIKALPPFLQQT